MKREGWETDFNDEPQIDGKRSLDLFNELFKAAGAERRKHRWPDMFTAIPVRFCSYPSNPI